MHLFIIKDGHMFARTSGEGIAEDFSLMTAETIPEYPTDGKTYQLDLVDGQPAWVEYEPGLSAQEQIDALAQLWS